MKIISEQSEWNKKLPFAAEVWYYFVTRLANPCIVVCIVVMCFLPIEHFGLFCLCAVRFSFWRVSQLLCILHIMFEWLKEVSYLIFMAVIWWWKCFCLNDNVCRCNILSSGMACDYNWKFSSDFWSLASTCDLDICLRGQVFTSTAFYHSWLLSVTIILLETKGIRFWEVWNKHYIWKQLKLWE
jgi:hypothetical protein